MWEKLKLAMMSQAQKLDYIENKADKIGKRIVNGHESVLYMLGSLFIEIVYNEKAKDIRIFSNVNELRHVMEQEILNP